MVNYISGEPSQQWSNTCVDEGRAGRRNMRVPGIIEAGEELDVLRGMKRILPRSTW
ncbi:MAG TPA: hypothetical protein VMS89_05630 [Methanoregulaceae archaeon]|nr:hypothetical protein [Methanoregulaceae archaeon]